MRLCLKLFSVGSVLLVGLVLSGARACDGTVQVALTNTPAAEVPCPGDDHRKGDDRRKDNGHSHDHDDDSGCHGENGRHHAGGCGDDVDDCRDLPPPTDLDAAGATEVNVCVEGVDLIFKKGPQRVRTIEVSRTIDLRNLENDVATSLGLGQYSIGLIAGLTLALCEQGHSVVVDGASAPLLLANRRLARVKVSLPGGFEVREGITRTAILTFDAARSVRPGADYWVLTPVVQLVEAPILLAVTDPQPGAFVQPEVTVRGTVASEDPLESLTVNGLEAAINGLDWNAALTLEEGDVAVSVVAIDSIGNVAEKKVNVVADGTPPEVVLVAPAAAAVNTRDLQIDATFSDVSGISEVHVFVDGEDRTDGMVGESNRVTGVVTVPQDGPVVISVEATDGVGLTGSASAEVLVDTVPPVLEILSPTSLTNNPVHFLIHYEDGTSGADTTALTVQIGSADVTSAFVAAEVEASADLTIPPGTHLVEVTIADHAGNVSTARQTFRVDDLPPVITLTPDMHGLATQAASLVVVMTVTDETGVARVSVNGTLAQAGAGPDVYTAGVELAEGHNPISIEAEDDLGQGASIAFDVIRDTAPPEAGMLLFGDQPIDCGGGLPYFPNTLQPSLSVFAGDDLAGIDPRAGVDLLVAGVDQWQTPRSTLQPFQQTVTLAPGFNDVELVVRDRAGNEAHCTAVMYGVDLRDFRSADDRIPGARLRVPGPVVDAGASFSVTVDDSVPPATAVDFGAAARRTVGLAVDFSLVGGGDLDLSGMSPPQCAQIVVPYAPDLAEINGVPEDALRLVRLSNPAEVASGSVPIFEPVDVAVTIDPVRNTATACTPHLSTYALASLVDPPIGLVSQAYVINNGSAGAADQALVRVDLDYMKLSDPNFDLRLPSTAKYPDHDLVLAYAHKAQLVPGTSLLAVAYRRHEVPSYAVGTDIEELTLKEEDEILLLDLAQRQVVGGISFLPGGDVPDLYQWQSRVLDFEPRQDGSAIVVAFASSAFREHQGIYEVPLPDVADPAASFVVVTESPLLPLALPARADIALAGDTVLLRAGPAHLSAADGPPSALEAALETFRQRLYHTRYRPYYGFDYLTPQEIRERPGLGPCLAVDSSYYLWDHTYACGCDEIGCSPGQGCDCLGEVCGGDLTYRGAPSVLSLPISGFSDVEGTPLACSFLDVQIGEGLAHGTMEPFLLRTRPNAPSGQDWAHSGVFDVLALALAAGQLAVIDLPAAQAARQAGEDARSASVTTYPLTSMHDVATTGGLTPDPSAGDLVIVHPNSQIAVTQSDVWIAATRMRADPQLFGLFDMIDVPGVGMTTGLWYVGDVPEAPSVVARRFPRDDTAGMQPTPSGGAVLQASGPHIGRTGLAIDSLGRAVSITYDGKVLVADADTGSVAVVGQLPAPTAGSGAAHFYTASLARTSLTFDNIDSDVTVIAAVADDEQQQGSDPAGEPAPESMLLLLTDDGLLTTGRLLSTTADRIQFEAYGALPTTPVVPLDSDARYLQSLFAYHAPWLFTETGARAGPFQPVYTSRSDGHGLAVVLRDESGDLPGAGFIDADIALRIFAVDTQAVEEVDALTALQEAALPAPVRVRRYGPRRETLMLVARDHGTGTLTLHHWDREETDTTTGRVFDVFEPNAPPAFPEADLDDTCAVPTAAGVAADFCIDGLDLDGAYAGDGERLFVADFVRIGTEARPTSNQAFQLSPASDAVTFVLDTTPPQSNGPHLFVGRSSPVTFDFQELVAVDADQFRVVDEREQPVAVEYGLENFLLTDPPFSRLTITPTAVPLDERAWYVSDVEAISDRAGNTASVFATPAWRTRSDMYESLLEFALPASGATLEAEKTALAQSFEDGLAGGGVLFATSLPQEQTSPILKQALLSGGMSIPPNAGADLLAWVVQFYDPDGLFYSELDSPAPRRIMTRELLEQAYSAGLELLSVDAASQRIGFSTSRLGCGLVKEPVACLANTFLEQYGDLRRAGLVYVDAARLMRELVRFAREQEATGALALDAAAMTTVEAALTFFEGIMDERASAAIGLFASGLDQGNDETTFLATFSLSALIAGVADAVVVEAGTATFRYGGETIAPADPLVETCPGLPARRADVIAPVQRTIPPTAFTTSSSGGASATLGLSASTLDFKKRWRACTIVEGGNKQCLLVSSNVRPSEFHAAGDVPMGIGQPDRGTSSQLLLVKNLLRPSEQQSTLSFEVPEGIVGFDLSLKAWSAGADLLSSWEPVPSATVASSRGGVLWSRTLTQDLDTWPAPTYPGGGESWIVTEFPNEQVSFPYSCQASNPLSLCEYRRQPTADGGVTWVWWWAAPSYWRTPRWPAPGGDTVAVSLHGPGGAAADRVFGCDPSANPECQGVDFAVQVDDVRFYAPGSTSPLREGASYTVDEVVAGEQVVTRFDGAAIDGSLATVLPGGARALAVAGTDSTHTVEVTVTGPGGPVDGAAVEVCAAPATASPAEVQACTTHYPAQARGGGRYEAVVAEPVDRPSDASPFAGYVVYHPRTAPTPAGTPRHGAALVVAYDYQPPAVVATTESQDCVFPVDGAVALEIVVKDDLAGGYLTATQSGACPTTDLGGWPTWGARSPDSVSSTVVHLLIENLCAGENIVTLEAEDLVGKRVTTEVTVAAVTAPGFEVSDRAGHTRVGRGATLEFVGIPPAPAGSHYEFEAVPAGPSPSTGGAFPDPANPGVFTTGSAGLLRVSGTAVTDLAGCEVSRSNNVLEIVVTDGPASAIVIGKPNSWPVEELGLDELARLEADWDVLPIEYAEVGTLATAPAEVPLEIVTARGASTLQATKSRQRGPEVVYYAEAPGSLFPMRRAGDEWAGEVGAVDYIKDPDDSNLGDSEAFFDGFGVTAANRALFRGYGQTGWAQSAAPAAHPASVDFLRAGGVQHVTVQTPDGVHAADAFLQNQADIYLFSGHGHHATGMLDLDDGQVASGNLTEWRGGDIDVFMISGCSVLDISDYRAESFGRRTQFSLYVWKGGGLTSPGEQWESVGARVLLGWAWSAPTDISGADEIIDAAVTAMVAGSDPIEAWRDATNRPDNIAFNAAAIDARTEPHIYYYWDEPEGMEPTWTAVVKQPDGWGTHP